jgi:hypothetical protein
VNDTAALSRLSAPEPEEPAMRPKPPSGQRRPRGPPAAAAAPSSDDTDTAAKLAKLKAKENMTAAEVMAANELAREQKELADKLARIEREHVEAEMRQVEAWQADTKKQVVRPAALSLVGACASCCCRAHSHSRVLRAPLAVRLLRA